MYVTSKGGVDLFRAVCKEDLEDMVAKHKMAPYGIQGAWLKIKNCAYSQAKGRDDFFKAIATPKLAGLR